MKYEYCFTVKDGIRYYGPIALDVKVHWDGTKPLPGPKDVPASIVDNFRHSLARIIGWEAMHDLILGTFGEGNHIGAEIGCDVGDGLHRILSATKPM